MIYDFKDLENTPSLPQSLDIFDILILLKSIHPLFKKKWKIYIWIECCTPVISVYMYVDFSLSDFNVSLMSSGTGINRDEQLQHTVVVSYHDVPWASK